MFERDSSTGEVWLAEELRGEALESRPPFSESLHARIVAAVGSQRGAGLSRPRHTAYQRRLRRLARLALAAACVLLIAVAAWHWRDGSRRSAQLGSGRSDLARQSPDPAAVSVSSDAGDSFETDLVALSDYADGALQNLQSLLDSAMAGVQSAYVDQDFQAAATELVEGLPDDLIAADVPPIEEW
ncbi:MAG: hypothetical protein ABSG68_05815 [Thermoguttaceae bacterium]|jgi:hypothetical protein